MPRKSIPKYRRHKASGQAVVTLNGRDHYLGPFGSERSRAEYDRLLGEWLANGRRLPSTDDDEGPSIGELMLAYIRFAKDYYRKNGEPTNEINSIRESFRPLRQLYTNTLARDFGPLALKTVREQMIEAGLSRPTINDRIGRIKRMFRWATENEMVDPRIHQALSAVSGLRRGRSAAKEPTPIRPVEDAAIEATLPHVSPQVSAMIQIQYWTGMRPGEVTIMRRCDLDLTGEVWIYRPQSHKTEHHGYDRTIALGPKAQEILRPWLRADAQAYLFSPLEAEAHRHKEMRAARKTPVQPSQRNRKKKRPLRKPGDRYTTVTYRRAIDRGCHLAKIPSWAPNQLRHACATRLRKEYGIEAARTVLGHRSAAVTEIYAEIDRGKALTIMGESG